MEGTEGGREKKKSVRIIKPGMGNEEDWKIKRRGGEKGRKGSRDPTRQWMSESRLLFGNHTHQSELMIFSSTRKSRIE